MTPKPAGWDELHLAENPAVELLESLGYAYVAPEALEPERASLKATVLAGRLAAALKRLNPWLSQTNVAKAVKAVTQVPAASLAEANEKVYTSLTYGIALEQDRGGERKSQTVQFLDFDRPERNEWMITRQYRVLGSKKHVIPDVVAFVNGLPLAVMECKSPTIGDAWKAEAVKQLRRYQEAGPALGRPRTCAPRSSPGSGATRPSGCPNGSRRGGRRPASRRPASSSPTSGSAGSCDHRGTIRLNWRIVQAPMRLVDYVVVHELVHLRHRGHGRDYWQAVGRVHA